MAKIIWKTKQEIEEEKNRPQPPTTEERLEIAEDTILDLMTTIAMLGGK